MIIEFLYMQIRLGHITLENIPEKYREGVRALLERVTK